MKRLLLVSILMVAKTVQAQSLSLENYLDQVKGGNASFQEATTKAEATSGLLKEADLVFTPELFAEARTGFDQKLQRPSFFIYDGMSTSSYKIGVSKKTRIGLKASVSYLLTDMEINGAEAMLGNDTRFTDGAAQFEVSMPLWKDGFGRSNRANEEITRAQANVNKYAAESQSSGILVNAEIAYWRLASAAEQLTIEEQSLTSAKNIHAYVLDKKRKDLGESADVLQAKALIEAYSLQVQQAEAEYRSAQREFNFYLNRQAHENVPPLQRLNFEELALVEIPSTRPGNHPDIEVSRSQAKLAKASSVVAAEKNKPQLDLYGSYTTYGQDVGLGSTINESYRFNRDGAYIGVQFSMPLAVSSMNEAKKSAQLNATAAEQNLKFLQYAQDQQWIDLVEKINDAKQSLKLATLMEKAQKEKLENERVRLRQGRTTTYQVLLFEQDYNQAQASRVKSAARILNLKSQSKLYQVHSESEIES